MRKTGMMFMAAILLLITACSEKPNTVISSQQTQEEMIRVVMHADYPHYEDATALANNSNCVFKGTVEKYTYEMIDVASTNSSAEEIGSAPPETGLPYTVFQITVDESYKGDQTVGSSVNLIRLGGIFEDKEYVVAENAVSIETGEKYVFVCRSFEGSPYLVLLNLDQSVFKVDEADTADKSITLNEVLLCLKR